MTGADFLGPVFLVGCPRSGTTLLQRLLDAHPLVSIAPETFFIRRFWKKRRVYGDLRDCGRFERLVSDVTALQEFADMGLDAEGFRAAARAVPRAIDALFSLLLAEFAKLRGTPWVGEKTPNHLLYMRTLERFFPDARFVHIVRDPRAVALSWRGVPWSNGSLAQDAEVWRRYLATARAKPPRQRERLLLLRYEELVAHPEPQLRKLCEFLGLPFHPAMLAGEAARELVVDLEREPWKQGAAGPIHCASVDRWRSVLSAAEVRAVETVTWFEMKAAGYRPEHGLVRLLPGMARHAARRAAKTARKALKRRSSAP
ncbi:MAG: sulfotransferase [Planctomycetes bacterium]|nr:sulfotransferase [Planctomycetota bacterium]